MTIVSCLITTISLSQELKPFENNGKYGFKNGLGEIVILATFDSTLGFDYANKIAMVKRNEKWGGINTSGEEIIEFKFEGALGRALPIWEGGDQRISKTYLTSVICTKMNGKWGFIDISGKEVVPFKYDDFNNAYSSCPFLLVSLNGKQGIIDYEGKDVYPFEIDSVIESGDGKGKDYKELEYYKVVISGKKKKIILNKKTRQFVK